ncbi:MAG: PEPxxWA-CTERM sorting domain-containing protein [Sphingomicrobium sp.]
MKLALKTAVAVLAMATATPSFAALTIVAPCSSTTPNPDATACAGFYAGNLLNSASIADINLALDALVGGNFPDVVFSNLDPTKVFFSGSGDDPNAVVTFQSALSGDVIIGANFGDAGTGLGPRTVFYRFNFGSPTTSVAFNTQGFSGGVLVQGTPVPEAATWAMMLVGFAGIGFAMRRRRITLPQIA